VDSVPDPGHLPPEECDITLEAMSAVEGLDTATGLTHVMGDSKLYIKLLLRFIELHGQDAVQMGELLDTSSMGDIKRRVHTLKGVSATLGAVRIELLCRCLEKEILELSSMECIKERLRGPLDELRVELQGLVDALDTLRTAKVSDENGECIG
jgi:HPt (histidine-containing phosphotransfer) domain-containing protein